MALFSNLGAVTETILNSSRSIALSALEAKLKDAKMKGKLRFYYRDSNGPLLRVLVNSALQTYATAMKNSLISEAKNLLYSKKKVQLRSKVISEQKAKLIDKGQLQNKESSENAYGHIQIKDTANKDRNIYCRDFYGNFCADGLMLRIPTIKDVKYSISKQITTYKGTESATYNTESSEEQKDADGFGNFSSKNLVWYDATALVTINSEKNVVLTKVAGRDYSRKELISNGDISFSVSGHIFSDTADVYPEDEVQKFVECMQYKGIVEVNNISLGQFNINKILIKDFSVTPVEGSKSHQTYTFNAVGIQPDSEVEVTEDALEIDQYISLDEDKTESKWATFMKNLAVGTATSILDFADGVSSTAISKIKVESIECQGGKQ